MSEIINIADLCGWVGKDDTEALKAAYKEFGPSIKQMPIFADTPKRFMLWEITRALLGDDTPNYAQQIGDPYVKDTMVLMADGSEKPIQNVKIGDKVLNHKNEIALVTNTIKKNFTGDIVTVKLRGYHRTLSATETHTALVLPYHQYRFKYNGVADKKFGDLSLNDWMMIPFGKITGSVLKLDLADITQEYVYDENYIYYHQNNKTSYKVKRFIDINEDFAWLVGIYLAEGGLNSPTNPKVTFSLNIKETEYVEKIRRIVKEIFDVDVTLQKTGVESCIRVYIPSHIVGSFFSKFIPGNLYSKSVPNLFFNVSKNVRMNLLKGWLDGDGYNNPKVNASIGYTSSPNLGNDMTKIGFSCGLCPKTRSRLRKTRASCENFEIGFYGTDVSKIYPENINKQSKEITCNNTPYGYARPIEHLERKAVINEEVYCIVTENEYSIIVNGIASKNCVSFGAKNACEYLQAFQLKNDKSKWRFVFPPYIYGISRVQIGGGRLGNSDGSLGIWATQGLIKYGCLFNDVPGVPQYSGSVAKSWGRSGPPKNFIDEASKYLLKMQMDAAKVTMWEQLKSAISNGYPVTVASNYGFTMKPASTGYHEQSGSWGHQMVCVGYDESDVYEEPCVCILNSWSDVMGTVIDKVTNAKWPVGTLRVRKSVFLKMLVDDGGDSWAYSNLDLGFVPRLPESAFSIF